MAQQIEIYIHIVCVGNWNLNISIAGLKSYLFFSFTLFPFLDQLIALHTTLVHYFHCSFHASNGKIPDLGEPNLMENARLVPVVSITIQDGTSKYVHDTTSPLEY